MKKRLIPHVSFLLVVITLFASLGGSTAVAQGPDQLLATVTVEADKVSWQPHVISAGFVLTISGPDNFHLQHTYQLGEPMAFGIARDTDSSHPDGVYRYELVSLPFEKPGEPAEEERGLTPAAEALVQSGSFSILDGSFVIQGLVAGTDRDPGGLIAQDQVIVDDLIVDGSACVGFDCVNGESFGFDTIRLKENNLRIKFQDTSTTGSFPTNDWMLVANDSSNGGASYFAINDVDSGRNLFLVEAGAPANSLYIDDYGRVGLGTSSPYVEMHIADGDTPTVRLDQDGSSGWSPQVWDVAGNESNFFIRDATNGSKLPFRIQPGAPSSALTIKADGSIGMGTWSPAASLEIEETNANAKLVLDRTDGATFKLVATDNKTAFGTVTNHKAQILVNDGPHTTFDTNGDLIIEGGVLHENSNFYSKENFVVVDPKAVLALLTEVPISSWNLKSDDSGARHMGPMAQDFYQAFGLGMDDKHLAPLDTNGVALAAIQGLNELVQEKEIQINALEAQNTELEARLSALEQRLPPQTSFVTVLPWLLCGLLLLGLAMVMGKRLYVAKQ
jgi:hypothetical protein